MTPFPLEDVISVIILDIYCVGQLLRLLLLTIWTSICVSLQICPQIVLCVSSKILQYLVKNSEVYLDDVCYLSVNVSTKLF